MAVLRNLSLFFGALDGVIVHMLIFPLDFLCRKL